MSSSCGLVSPQIKWKILQKIVENNNAEFCNFSTWTGKQGQSIEKKEPEISIGDKYSNTKRSQVERIRKTREMPKVDEIMKRDDQSNRNGIKVLEVWLLN